MNMGNPMNTLKCEVVAKEVIGGGITVLTLKASEEGVLPRWSPGAHISLLLPGMKEKQYSLCGPVADTRHWRIAIKRRATGKGGSVYICDRVAVGQELEVRGPTNTFKLTSAAKYLFIAGGIGITPIMPMLQMVETMRKPWELVYTGKSMGCMAFIEELHQYGSRIAIHESVECGRIDIGTIINGIRERTEIYCCGPNELMDAVEQQCNMVSNMCSLHLERFEPRAVVYKKNREFDIKIASTGKIIRVGENETIAEALERSGVEVLTSCREGTCGTCLTAVLDGIPEHRDSVLTEEERASNQLIMVCCSRALDGSLILDI